jgi:hypothetical protein
MGFSIYSINIFTDFFLELDIGEFHHRFRITEFLDFKHYPIFKKLVEHNVSYSVGSLRKS